MTTIKSFTSLEQSKKLAEILPLESADMVYRILPGVKDNMPNQYIAVVPDRMSFASDIPCWSFAALLGVLPSATLDSSNDHYYRLHCMEKYTEWYGNPIDACYELITKLYEEKLL